ncbi:SprT family protein [Paenibacillus senegalensis]|uniref:SprT family protein n=1 Tax=Paenibacillus senegalensis TaxID=1465766 RepID=UPI0002893FB7|nr:SprT family protein [Paenibacillus senegalensis]
MNNDDLQRWVEQISEVYFQRPFVHKAVFNPRLSATGGRYFTGTHNIEISLKQYEAYGKDEVESIIKHELCHYHLHLTGKGYRHRDQDFRLLLAQVGGSRYCQALPSRQQKARERKHRYLLRCTQCSAEYLRKRRMDTAKFVCGSCKGRLELFVLE